MSSLRSKRTGYVSEVTHNPLFGSRAWPRHTFPPPEQACNTVVQGRYYASKHGQARQAHAAGRNWLVFERTGGEGTPKGRLPRADPAKPSLSWITNNGRREGGSAGQLFRTYITDMMARALLFCSLFCPPSALLRSLAAWSQTHASCSIPFSRSTPLSMGHVWACGVLIRMRRNSRIYCARVCLQTFKFRPGISARRERERERGQRIVYVGTAGLHYARKKWGSSRRTEKECPWPEKKKRVLSEFRFPRERTRFFLSFCLCPFAVCSLCSGRLHGCSRADGPRHRLTVDRGLHSTTVLLSAWPHRGV